MQTNEHRKWKKAEIRIWYVRNVNKNKIKYRQTKESGNEFEFGGE